MKFNDIVLALFRLFSGYFLFIASGPGFPFRVVY